MSEEKWDILGDFSRDRKKRGILLREAGLTRRALNLYELVAECSD